MLNSRKRLIVSISLLAVLFISIAGITYAYYATKIFGNPNATPSLNLTSGYLSIGYDELGSSITAGSDDTTQRDLTYTKTFTVTNNGVADTYFGVAITDYEVYTLNEDSTKNYTTFERPQDWTYELSSNDTIIKTGTFPTKDEAIITAKPLAVNESITLTLTVTYDYITVDEMNALGLTVNDVNQTADMNKKLSFNVSVNQTQDTLAVASEGTLLYAINNEKDETTLKNADDDYGVSYYFTGNVTNNFVNYSGMCWRIVRVQGDGTIKLVLADENNECSANVDQNEDGTYSGFNINNGVSAFINGGEDIPYKLSPTTDASEMLFSNSNILTSLNTWATKQVTRIKDEIEITEKNLDTTQLVSAEWCSDISETDQKYYNANNEEVTESWDYIGYIYGPNSRYENASPTFKCNSIGENESKAQRHENIIGLLTTDEIIYAGANDGSEKYYLMDNASSGIYYWTISPFYSFNNEYTPSVGAVSASSGIIAAVSISNLVGTVRPSVVLKSTVTATTNSDTTLYGEPGTQSNPYVIN